MKNIIFQLTIREAFALHQIKLGSSGRRKQFYAGNIYDKLYKQLGEQLSKKALKQLYKEWIEITVEEPPKPKKTNPMKPLPTNKRPSSEDMLGKF